MVANIFLNNDELEAVEKLLANMHHLYKTDKSCKVVFDEIRATIQQKRINTRDRHTNKQTDSQPEQSSPQDQENLLTAPKAMLAVEKQEMRTITEQMHATNRSEKAQGKTKKQANDDDKQSNAREPLTAPPTALPPLSTTSSPVTKPKPIRWYQWENSKTETGGFNRESMGHGERVFRVRIPKRAIKEVS